MSRRILSICYDRALLRTRQRLLQRDGYAVVSAGEIGEAKTLCRNGNFDLVIIDNSVAETDAREILGEMQPGSPMLAVLRNGERRIQEADVLSASDSAAAPVAEILYSKARSA
ncbi:MAG: hypothetical protein ACXVZJ_14700 [Terriglobales bacterium]